MLHITPAACIAHPGGGSSGQPTLLSVSNTENQAIGCGINWRRNVGWTLDFINDADYEIEIYDDILLVVIASGLLTSSSPYVHDVPNGTGDPLYGGVTHYAQYRVRLVRSSDSAVISEIQTSLATVETGGAC